jgi:transposase
MHARILLATDDTREPKLTVRQVAEKCDSTTTTVQTVRRLYATQGLEAALERKKRETPPVEAKITGDVEAKLVALACTKPPDGREHWALRLLADRAVELEIIDSISHSSVGTVLKKHNLSLT